ncbi:unnamed protein product [Rotaria sp. Silwood1]|nr:unnamed protein product [Rotaria sp. Silwood1]
MTSENELDVIKPMDTIESKDEQTLLTTSVEQAITPKEEDEKVNVEKPKRPGRKKRESSSILDTKEEANLNIANNMDTQPLFEQPIILEGKRSRKPTLRLELSDLTTPKKELSIPQGHGKPLGEIEYINYQITHASTDAVSRMRNICFGRRASQTNIRQNLREFKGFEFERDGDEYQRHLNNLIKLKKDQLRSISDILGLPASGRNNEHAERILNFLMNPIDEGKPIPERKKSIRRSSKKSSTNSKQSSHTDDEENEFEDKTENGNDDKHEEIFNDEEDEEEEVETDDDYIGSDEESGLNTKDDPDDFVYQPGKKTPKKRTSVKRSRKGTGAATRSKRGRKRSKIIIDEKTENEDVPGPAEQMQINDEEIKKSNEDNVTTEINTDEVKNDNLQTIDTNLPEQNDATMNKNVTECVRQYCNSQINTASVPIRCPNGECNNRLSLNELHSLLSDAQYQLYNKLLLDHEVTNDPHRLFCPHVDCGQVLSIIDESKIHKEHPMTCTKCQTTFCLKCRSQWHPNEHCSDLLTPYEMEADSNIKRCPRCRFPLEWIAGCAQIMCVNCKHIFCWYCLKSLDNDFFLLHFESGPCRNRLGHSRASLFLHRLTIVGIFIGLILLLLIAIPFLILTAPCLLCCRYKQIKNRLKNLTKLGQRFQQQQYTPTAHPSPSSSLNQLNNSSLIDIEQDTKTMIKTSLLSSSLKNINQSKPELSSV